MSDRLALADAIEEAGISRDKATRIASVIFDAIHQNVATKADIQAEMASLRSEMHEGFARQDVAMERLRSTVREMEGRIALQLGGIVAAGVAIIVAAQHFWPPH